MKGIPLSDEEYISSQEMFDSFSPEILHNKRNQKEKKMEWCNNTGLPSFGPIAPLVGHRNSGSGKLSKEDKKMIIADFNAGMSQVEIAAKYKVSGASISYIVNHKRGR